MKIKVGINGMGRIGRMILRSIIENNYSNLKLNILIIEQIRKLVQIF